MLLIDIRTLKFLFQVIRNIFCSVRDAFNKALAKAEILDFHLHDCRHTFASRLIQQGVDPYRVQLLLGHKSFSMTRRYAHHNVESLRSAVYVLDGCCKSVTSGVGSD